MKKLINVIMIVLLFVGCSGTLYSHKKIPVKITNAQAKIYGKVEGLDLNIDIERCWSTTGECSKILASLYNENIKIEGINWDNYQIIIKEK